MNEPIMSPTTSTSTTMPQQRSSPIMSQPMKLSSCPPKPLLLPRRVSCTEIEQGGVVSASSSSSTSIPVELESYDVVCDAGSNYSDHVGNRRLAITLSINCKKYMAAKTLSERKAISASVVETVSTSYRPGGRFRKCDKNNHWVDVDRKQAVQWIYKSFQRIIATPKIPSPDQQQSQQDVSSTNNESDAVVSSSTSLNNEATIAPRQSLLLVLNPEDDTIDGQLAKLLLKQHHIFTALSEKAEGDQAKRKSSPSSNSSTSRKRQRQRPSIKVSSSNNISNEIALPRRISL